MSTERDEARYYALLDAGYSPADASLMARVKRFHGPSPRWTRSRIPAERPEPEALTFSRPTDEELAESRRQAALAAVRWASRWRTWPKGGDESAALQAALAAVNRNPLVSKYELAKVAANAARRKVA